MKRYLAWLLLALPFLAMAPALADSRGDGDAAPAAVAAPSAKPAAGESDGCALHTLFATAANLARRN